MFRRISNWVRVVLPSAGLWLAVALIPAALIEASFLNLFLRFPQDLWPAMVTPYTSCRLVIWGGCGFFYGIYRALAFHPLYDTSYRQWLKMTPWSLGKPLVGAAPWLLWQDLVVVLALMAFSHEMTRPIVAIPIAFLTSYLIVNTILNWMTGEWQLAFVVAFVVTGLPLLYAYPQYIVLVELVCVAVATWATRRSLSRFPWELSDTFERRLASFQNQSRPEPRAAWPFDQLAAQAPRPWISIHDGLCVSLLLGWFEFTLFTMIYGLGEYTLKPVPPANVLFGAFPSLVAAAITLCVTYVDHWSPLSLWGRLRAGRWVIPDWDKMMIAPVLAALISALMHKTLQVEFAAAGTMLAFLLILVCSPSIEEWWLTGHYRLVNVSRSADYVQTQ